MSSTIEYPPGDLEVLAGLEERHFWFGVRRRIIIDALRRWFPSARDYLEIGAGTGFVTKGVQEAFPTWRVLASDPLSDMAEIPRIDAHQIPFNSSFDIVGAYDVIEHIDDDCAALRQMHQACRPGGGVLITVPQHPALWSPADTAAHHYRRYTRDELLGKLNVSGFEVLGWSSFNTLNLPLMYLRSRFLSAVNRPPCPATPAPTLNTLLALTMSADRLLIGAGLRLPWGGSLLVSARRRERA